MPKKKSDPKKSETDKNPIVSILDANKNGKLEIEDLIIKSLKLPGIVIHRGTFLHKVLDGKYPTAVVENAIKDSPYAAGITHKDIGELADAAIKHERLCVSGLSFVLGVPGSFAALANAVTIPADILQYYAYMLRAAQKLLYLYGFPELITKDNNGEIDQAAVNIIILCLGSMYCVAGAKNGLLAITNGLGRAFEKEILEHELTQGAVYPLVSMVAKSLLNKEMSQEIFAQGLGKAIPVIGGAVGGAITYFAFKPCCDRLKNNLEEIMFARVKDAPSPEEPETATDCSPASPEESDIEKQ